MCARGGREPEPIPPTLDDLSERANGNALTIGGHERVAFDEADHRRRTASPQSDCNRYPLKSRYGRARQLPSIDLERHAVLIVAPQQVIECGIEQRLEMTPDGFLEIARVEQRGQLIRQGQSHRGATGGRQARRRHPLPRRPIPRRQVPLSCNVRGAAPRFGHHLTRHEKPKLDADAGKSDALAAALRARCDVVVPGQLSPLHPASIVHDRQRRVSRVREEADANGTRVERIGNDLGEDRFLERAGVGVPKVFEEMLEVDSSFAHGSMLSRGSWGEATAASSRRPIDACAL